MTRSFLKITLLSATLLSATLGVNVALAACPSGTFACGADYCAPVGRVCCAGVGRPDISCPAGSSCNANGSCTTSGGGSSSGGSSSGGGGTCPSGTESCGSKCIPAGATCCSAAGYSGSYCPQGYYCKTDGTCASQSGSSSGGGSSSGSYGGSSGSYGGGSVKKCAPTTVGAGCGTVQACCESRGSAVDCWYEADGRRFDCDGTCSTADAQRVVDYCSDDDPVHPGCSASPAAPTSGAGGAGLLWAAAAGLGLGALALARRVRARA